MRQTSHTHPIATNREPHTPVPDTPVLRDSSTPLEGEYRPRHTKRGMAALLIGGVLCAFFAGLSPTVVAADGNLETGAPVEDASTLSGATYAASSATDPSRFAKAAVAARAPLLYAFPAGSKAVTLYLDGREVLRGHAVDIEGVVYVPVQRFADLFGTFRGSYNQATEEVVLAGHGTTISVRAGAAYITVNDRILYAGKNAPVRSLRGWIFVPLSTMTEAVGASVKIRAGYYDAFITTGNVADVPTATEVYDSGSLYWLSRIISAEARGESLEGQIAVGNVVLNRVASPSFPNSIYGVIFDKRYGTQFAPVDNGSIYNQPTTSAIMAAKICLEGYSLSDRALYFFNPTASSANWIISNRPYLMDIGNHRFYG